MLKPAKPKQLRVEMSNNGVQNVEQRIICFRRSRALQILSGCCKCIEFMVGASVPVGVFQVKSEEFFDIEEVYLSF